MKIKITHPIPEKNLQAGLIYDLPDDAARKIMEMDYGFEIKKVTNDNRKNNAK